MNLIDRDEELEQLKKNVHGVLFANLGANGYGTILVPFEEVEKVIADQPTIEIVQCRECRHWDADKNCGYCDIWDHYISNEAFYCGCGDRREDDDSD